MAGIKRWFPVLIMVMTFILIGVWLQMEKKNEQAMVNPLQAQLEQLSTTQTELASRMDHLQSQIGDSAQAWVLSEVYYYLNIAHLRLSVFNDVKTALQLMHWSQQRLITTHAPVGLQEALLTDIAELSAVPVPDVNAVTQSLAYIETQLPSLTLHRPTAQTEEATVEHSLNASTSDWKSALQEAWNEIKHLIRVQPRSASMDYILFDETILRQTVHVELQRAGIAAVMGQNDLYQASLQQAIVALQQFFASTAQLQEIIASLQSLQQQAIVPTLPAANRALIWLQMQSGLGSV